MEQFEQYIENVKSRKEIILSDSLTNVRTVIGIIILISINFQIINFYEYIEEQIFIVVLLVLGIHFIYLFQLFFASEATLTGKTLMIKKVFRKEVIINIDKLNSIDPVNFNAKKLTRISYKNGSRSEIAIVYNSKKFVFGENNFVVELIRHAQKIELLDK